MHRHFYRLARRWNHPNGYLFECRRCRNLGFDAQRFIRYNAFWGQEVINRRSA